MEKILLAQFIAHLIADFFAQPECVSRRKQRGFLRSRHIYIHTLIVFATSLALTFTCGFVLWAGVIALMHFGIDAGKCAIERSIVKKKKLSGDTFYSNPTLFFADQILHLAVISVAVLLYSRAGGAVPAYIDILSVRTLILMCGVLLCMKPTNVVVRVCLLSLSGSTAIAEGLKNEELNDKSLQAGRWIGSLERLMAFVLVVLGQFTAIGFIIAAKSVLRYGDNTHRTEYVLIGTLLSFGIAFALGVGVSSGVFENMINTITYIQ
jgi:hypothetical protein